MLAKDVRNGKKSCLSNANDDEPVFILRAQDELAPFCLEFWADALETAYKEAPRLDDDTHAKVIAKIDHVIVKQCWAIRAEGIADARAGPVLGPPSDWHCPSFEQSLSNYRKDWKTRHGLQGR